VEEERDHGELGDDERPPLPRAERRPPVARQPDGAQGAPPALAQTVPEPDRLHPYPPSGVRSPRRPSGRKTRIRIRIVKMIDVVQSVPGACQDRPLLNCSISPMQSAPRTAPGRLPMPPSTAAVNANRPSRKPVSNLTAVKNSV